MDVHETEGNFCRTVVRPEVLSGSVLGSREERMQAAELNLFQYMGEGMEREGGGGSLGKYIRECLGRMWTSAGLIRPREGMIEGLGRLRFVDFALKFEFVVIPLSAINYS